MIFELDESPFPVEEELVNINRQPEHEEAIKALLSGNQQRFLEILNKNEKESFNLSSQKALTQTFALYDSISKAQFDALLTQKLAELLIKSQVGSRFFETPLQKSLHNYMRQQYFEDKHKTKANQTILNAYKDIFRRIEDIEDLIFFTDFVINTYVRQPFDFVLNTSKDILTNKSEMNHSLMILEKLPLFNSEDQIIVKYCFCLIVVNLSKKAKNPYTDAIIDEVQQILGNVPYRRLAETVVALDPFQFVEYFLHNHKHPREIVEYDFKTNQIVLQSLNLHPDLRCFQIFSAYFKKMKYLEHMIQKYQIISHSSKFEDNKVLLGINYDLLTYDTDIGYEYTLKISSKTISQYIEFMNQLVSHLSWEFIPIREDKQRDKLYNLKYICKVFQNFITLNKLRSSRSEIHAIEHAMIVWGKLFIKWLQMEDIKNQEFITLAIQNYFSLFSFSEGGDQFPNLFNFESQFSKTIFELMAKLTSFPAEEECFKGIKNIFFGWSQQMIPQTAQLKGIINKMVTCFFSDSLTLKASLRQDVFETPAIFKNVKKTINDSIMQYIHQRYSLIESQKINSSSHPLAKNHSNFFHKIGYIISSRIIGEASEKFANFAMKFFLNYAHVWPILHSYRMWILQVCKESIDIRFQEKIGNLRSMIHIICNYIELNKQSELSKETVKSFNLFAEDAYLSINSLRMKRNKNNLSVQNCHNYLKFMIELEDALMTIKKIQGSERLSLKEYLKYGFNIQKELTFILQELKMTFRVWLCNSTRFLNVKEEQSIMNFIGHLIIDQVEKQPQEQTTKWTFICDIMGLSDIGFKSTISNKQIMGPLQKYTAKLNNKLEDFIPFNFSASLYSSIRTKYKAILKSFFTSLNQQQNEELWLIIEKLMLSSVVICGPCIFNGQNQEKTKEDMAFGVFYDQFEKITELLTEDKFQDNIKVLIMLEKKKKIFSKFYEVLKSKNTKIVERLRANTFDHHPRFRGRPMSIEDVMLALNQMGVSRDQAEIAIENIEYPDHNLAMEWLDNNQDRLGDLLTARIMERTRPDINRREMRREVSQGDIGSLSFDSFEEKIINLSKKWIKIIFKELFKKENMPEGETLKNILFMFMDSLKNDKAKKQYKNLYDKICQDLDQLNNKEAFSDQIGLLLILLEGTFLKTDQVKKNFYDKSINLKILSYLPKITTEQSISRVFSVINASLPVFNSTDVITPELNNYLAYLLDVILQHKISHKSQSQIMLKIAKTGKQNLMQRITRNLTIFFKENLIKDSIFTLINMILESDKTLSYVNAELDLKTFLYERYKHRLASFHPDKEHVLEIDIKEYSISFPKYERGSAIYEVSKQMLAKNKNKSKLLFYDCRKDKNQFDYSHFGNSKFVNFPIKEHFKTMIKSILTTLFETTDKQIQNQIIIDLHKLLYNYRILLPFTLHQQIAGTNLIDWLLDNHNHSKKTFKFLTFLSLNVNLFIKREGYNFISLSDFVCARIITHIMNSHENILWNSFSALYLSQVRKFSEFSTAKYSKDNNMSLVTFFEEIINKVNAVQYLPISEFLYIQYKRKLLDNLRRKYKLAGSNQESTFDRQFLNISPFFNSVSIKKQQKVEKNIPEAMLMSEEMDEDDDQDGSQMIFQNFRGGVLQRRIFGGDRQGQYDQLIVPLPISEPKPNEKESQMKDEGKQKQNEKLEPIVLDTCEYIEVILFEFDKYLSFQQEEGAMFEINQTKLPLGPISIPNLDSIGTKVNLENIYVDTELKVKKLSGFEHRIGEIFSIMSPNCQWQVKKENNNNNISQNNSQEQRILLSRRLIQSLNPLGEPNRQTLMTLERLIHGRVHRAEDGANNPPVRNINVNDIYQHLEEFTEPIIPVVVRPEPPKQEPMEIQQPKSEIQERKEEQKKDEKIIDQPQVPQQLLQSEIVSESKQAQPELIIIENSQPIEEEKQEEPYHPLPDEPIEEEHGHVSPAIEIETIVNPNNQGQIQVEQQHQNAENLPPNSQAPELIVEPIPVVNVENHPLVQEPPARQRQILAMLGLPQSFLRDVGLDEEFFDSLPEDLQQQQLMTFMAQQGASINRGGNRPNQPNQPQDLQSQNIAFLQSLDPQTRAQVLIQATPEFLASLPPNIREEADRHRSSQINRMIQQEQIQEERNYINNQKAKGPVVYPKIFKEQFSPMSEEAACSIFKGVFNLYPKVKLSALKILLENKTTQEKTIASIIALIYSFEEKQQLARIRSINKVQIVNKELKVTENRNWTPEEMSQIRTYLLHLVLEYIKIPVYKDQEFLAEKIKTQVYLEELQEYLKDKQYLDPIIELSSFALSYYSELAPELLKKAKDLPDSLFEKLVEGIRKEKWPNQLYDSLSNFSQNERLKQIFSKQFQEKPPKIEVLGKLLKYKFSHLSTLKKIHKDALEYYSSSYHEFLNQIFAIYTVETLNEIEPLLVKHKQIHFQVIKSLYLQGKELEKEPIGIILKKPELLDFETKKFIFRNHPKLRKTSGRRVHIEVDRTHLFQGSYNQLMGRTVRELQGKIQVSFINEPGYDAGGLRREWFLLVSRQIFNQDYALFQKSSSGSTYQPNPKSYVNPDHLNYFKFIGRFIGKALVQRELIDAYFTRAFYKMILGQQLEFKDLEAQDYQFFKSMEWLKDNKIDENIFTFSYIYDNFGNKVEKELVPGGKDIIVNQDNKLEYIEKYCMSKMRDDFSTQIKSFLDGFHEVVPQECISFFEAKELELLISGVPEVDIEDLKRNTDYSGYNPADQIIVWFWEVVSEYSQEDLAKLVQFITGTSKIPVEGFSHMIGMNGIQRISIHRDPCQHQLPKSHTCFNQLDLPNYASKEILKQKLGICLAWGSEGFGFM